mgnify:CR=1 FL=1
MPHDLSALSALFGRQQPQDIALPNESGLYDERLLASRPPEPEPLALESEPEPEQPSVWSQIMKAVGVGRDLSQQPASVQGIQEAGRRAMERKRLRQEQQAVPGR